MINHLFVTPPRQAEHADARMQTRRQNPDEDRRSSDDRKDDTPFDTEDKPVVSVQALLSFLQDFLTSLAPQTQPGDTDAGETPPPEGHAQADEAPSATTPKPPALDSAYRASARPSAPKLQAQKAAQAYQAGARTQPGNVGHTQKTTLKEAATALGLSQREYKTIEQLIVDLKQLSALHIEHLTLQKTESFLQSLVLSVETAKNDLKLP